MLFIYKYHAAVVAVNVENENGADNYFSPSKRMAMPESLASTSTAHPLLQRLLNRNRFDIIAS